MRKIFIFILLISSFVVNSQDIIRPDKVKLYVSYCNACTGVSGWKVNNDTIYIDTTSVTAIDTTNLSDSLRLAWLQKLNNNDTLNLSYRIDTTTGGGGTTDSLFIAWLNSWKSNGDTLTADTGKVSTSGDIIHGNLQFKDNVLLNEYDYPNFKVQLLQGAYNFLFTNYNDNSLFGIHDTYINIYRPTYVDTLKSLNNSYTLFPDTFAFGSTNDKTKIFDDGLKTLFNNDNPIKFTNDSAYSPTNNFKWSEIAGKANKSDSTTVSGASYINVTNPTPNDYVVKADTTKLATQTDLLSYATTTQLGAKSDTADVANLDTYNEFSKAIKLTGISATTTADSMLVIQGGLIKKQVLTDITTDTIQSFHVDSLFVNDYVSFNGSQVLFGTYTLLDGGSLVLPSATSGMIKCMLGNNLAGVEISYATDGTFRYSDSWGVVFFTDSGVGLRVFDSGTTLTFKNSTGFTYSLKIQGSL